LKPQEKAETRNDHFPHRQIQKEIATQCIGV